MTHEDLITAITDLIEHPRQVPLDEQGRLCAGFLSHLGRQDGYVWTLHPAALVAMLAVLQAPTLDEVTLAIQAREAQIKKLKWELRQLRRQGGRG